MSEIYKNKETIEANDPAHYKLLVIGLVIGLFGVFLRFTGTWTLIDIVSNVFLVIGTYICLKAVLRILK